MAFFAIYETATGRLTHQTSSVPSDKDLAAKGLSKKEYATKPDMLWNPSTLDFDNPRPAPQKQHKEFLLRFTFNEHVALRTLASTDVQVSVWIERMELRERVDQSTPEFKQGMIALVEKGVLKPARAKAIGEWT